MLKRPRVLVYAGVEKPVICDIYERKVSVKAAGTLKPETVLKKAQKIKKDSVLWPKKEGEKKKDNEKKDNEKKDNKKNND